MGNAIKCIAVLYSEAEPKLDALKIEPLNNLACEICGFRFYIIGHSNLDVGNFCSVFPQQSIFRCAVTKLSPTYNKPTYKQWIKKLFRAM